jgi:WD40 repeat protein
MEDGNHAIVWDLSTHTQTATLDQIGKINSVQFSGDGNFLATGSSSASIYLWNEGGNGAFIRVPMDLNVNAELSSLVFSPDSKWLAAGDSTGFAYLFDLNLGQEVSRLPHIDKVTSISFSPDGKQLATVSRKTIMLWDIPSIPIFTRSTLIKIACTRMTQNFDRSQWKQLFYEDAYYPICPNLPAGGN